MTDTMTDDQASLPMRPARRGSLQITAVTKTFPSGRGGATVDALRDVSLDVAGGEFVCILGASGCGKSTLLRLVAGFESFTDGSIRLAGRHIRGPGPERGVVFQDYGLFPWLSVAANIAYGPRQRGASKSQVKEVVQRYLSMVRLEAFAERFPAQLSGGMQQRVALARVPANQPDVLLMDEPFGALDSLTREQLQLSLLDIWHELKPTVLFVTHSVEEAVLLSDRVVVMSGGPNHGVPGFVAQTERIDLPHPRDVTSPEFNVIKRRLLDAVHRDISSTNH